MTEQLVRIQVMVPESLKQAIDEAARSKALAISPMLRSVLFGLYLPDQATIRRCRQTDPTLLVDSPVAYQAEGAE